MNENKVLIIHPHCRTTFFLRRISNYLLNSFPDILHIYNVKPTETSHSYCLERICCHSKDGLIIFLGHGRPDCLLGARTDLANTTISDSARYEFYDAYYNKENFITVGNINVFKGKKVFCLACDSSQKISDFAIDNGTTTFMGFGHIPSTIYEFTEKNIRVTKNLVSALKGEITYIIKKSLQYAIQKEYTFLELLNIISFITNQRIVSINLKQKRFKERRILTDYLYFFKDEIVIKGNKNASLIHY